MSSCFPAFFTTRSHFCVSLAGEPKLPLQPSHGQPSPPQGQLTWTCQRCFSSDDFVAEKADKGNKNILMA